MDTCICLHNRLATHVDVANLRLSLSPVYTIQPVVIPVVKQVWQQVVSCKCLYTRYNRLSNRLPKPFDNRLYRVYNRLSNRLYNPVWQPVVSCKRGIRALASTRILVKTRLKILLEWFFYYAILTSFHSGRHLSQMSIFRGILLSRWVNCYNLSKYGIHTLQHAIYYRTDFLYVWALWGASPKQPWAKEGLRWLQ